MIDQFESNHLNPLETAFRGIIWPAIPNHRTALILSILRQIEESQWWPEERLKEYQFSQLSLLLMHAYSFSPYYKKVLDKIDYKPGKQLDDNLFQHIPVLTRSQLQTEQDSLRCTYYPEEHGAITSVRTSGSTGRPISVDRSDLAHIFYDAYNLRDHQWHGRRFTNTSAQIRFIKNKETALYPQGNHLKKWGIRGFNSGNAWILRVDTPITQQVEWLERVKPDYLLTYPSNLKGILEVYENKNSRNLSLQQINTFGEILDEELRQRSVDILGTEVKDMYSCQEIGLLASQCPDHNTYHICSEHVLVEILREDNTPCSENETGRIVITDLHNLVMPLIRYEIGDYAEAGKSCPCGRGLPVINRIYGRRRNLMTLPNGDKVWPALGIPAYRRITQRDIRRVSFIQTDRDNIELHIEIDSGLTEPEERDLREYIYKRLPAQFNLVIFYHQELPVKKNGKFEEFISLAS